MALWAKAFAAPIAKQHFGRHGCILRASRTDKLANVQKLSDRVAVDASVVPKFLRGSLYAILLIAGLLSVPRLGVYGPLPTTTLLDAWIILFVIGCVLRGKILTTGLLLVLSAFLLSRVIPVIATLSPLEDFFQAYRWILYLAAFAVAVGRQWAPIRPMIMLMWALLIMAFVKAALTQVFIGSGARPGLLLENNFELALFCGTVAVLYRHMDRSRLWAIALLGALTVLSGSRSGAVAFLIVALYALIQARSTNVFNRFLLVCLAPILVLIPLWIFGERASPNGKIDRLNFLDVFLQETKGWDIGTWLIGTTPITPLSDAACARLSYYNVLFSSVGDGSCYSVILHAFVLRVVFDAGLLGLFFAFGVTWYVLRRAGVQFTLAACLILIAFANSLSVSGLNNPYVAFPILLAILTAAGVPSEPAQTPKPPDSRQLRVSARR